MARVFISYAHEDLDQASSIYRVLLGNGHVPWMDSEDLLPGQRWEVEIRRAITNSDFFVSCLSKRSVTKRGYIQKELKFALDILDTLPEQTNWLIPVRLDECQVPASVIDLGRLWLDWFIPDAEQKLLKSIASHKDPGHAQYDEPEIFHPKALEELRGPLHPCSFFIHHGYRSEKRWDTLGDVMVYFPNGNPLGTYRVYLIPSAVVVRHLSHSGLLKGNPVFLRLKKEATSEFVDQLANTPIDGVWFGMRKRPMDREIATVYSGKYDAFLNQWAQDPMTT